jgi:hypothetical protein
MRRILLIALAAGVVIALIAFLVVGAFPPRLVSHPVQHTIPNSQIAPG